MYRMVGILIALGVVMVTGMAMAAEDEPRAEQTPDVLDFKMKSLEGEEVDLSKYQGKVIVMVNVASRCGMTPQYEALQALHEEYGEKGLVILGFPSGSFNQELETSDQIAEFCEQNYGVSFDMFEKIDVKGEQIHPLYAYLTDPQKTGENGGEIKWNFTKFIISRDGQVVARYEPREKPDSEEFVERIEQELERPARS
jgi:glutathione peroxidase